MTTVTTDSVGWSARSFLIAGISTAMVGAGVLAAGAATGVAPATLPEPIRVTTAAVDLAAAGDVIINTYNALQPWVEWGFELADWGLSFVPGLWWIAPAIDLAYFTAQPVVESLVYSFAYLIDGNLDLIWPTLADGLTSAAANFVTFSIEWLYSIVPFPPLPPFFPPLPFIAAAAEAGPVAELGRGAAAAAAAAEGAEGAEGGEVSAEEPAQVSAHASADEPTGEPADGPTAEPAAESAAEPAAESAAVTSTGSQAASAKRFATRADRSAGPATPAAAETDADAISADAQVDSAESPGPATVRDGAERRGGSGHASQQQRRR